LIGDGSNELTGNFSALIQGLLENFKTLEKQVALLEEQIVLWHKQNDGSKRLAEILGIGSLTASALVASIGDVRTFKSCRQVASWLGLVPSQHSSSGKQMLLGIRKRGDSY
jgi:transposase